jgi:hypothetical protein
MKKCAFISSIRAMSRSGNIAGTKLLSGDLSRPSAPAGGLADSSLGHRAQKRSETERDYRKVRVLYAKRLSPRPEGGNNAMRCPRRQELIDKYSSAASALNRAVKNMNSTAAASRLGEAFRSVRSAFVRIQREVDQARAELEAHERDHQCK